ncbi:hypothetical protein SATRM34S_06230 [Streptomyces atroolivaceus]
MATAVVGVGCTLFFDAFQRFLVDGVSTSSVS